MVSTHERQLQDIVNRYRAEKRPWPTTARNMAAWAINNKLWSMRESQVVFDFTLDVLEGEVGAAA